MSAPISNSAKLVLFWGDTREFLTNKECRDLHKNATILHANPDSGLVLELLDGSMRKVIVYGIGDPGIPHLRAKKKASC